MFEFWLEEMVFWGHINSKEGIKVDTLKVKAITEWPRSTNVSKIEAFGSLLLLKFCEGFSKDDISLDQFIEENH